jgi:hypothetical protein
MFSLSQTEEMRDRFRITCGLERQTITVTPRFLSRTLSISRCTATQDDGSEIFNYFDIRCLFCSNDSSESVTSYVHKQ